MEASGSLPPDITDNAHQDSALLEVDASTLSDIIDVRKLVTALQEANKKLCAQILLVRSENRILNERILSVPVLHSKSFLTKNVAAKKVARENSKKLIGGYMSKWHHARVKTKIVNTLRIDEDTSGDSSCSAVDTSLPLTAAPVPSKDEHKIKMPSTLQEVVLGPKTPWIEIFDPTNKAFYYYNTDSRMSQVIQLTL